MLCIKFPDLEYFIKKNAIEMFTLAQLMDKIPTLPPSAPNLSKKQHIFENNKKATESRTFHECQDNRQDTLHPSFFMHRPIMPHYALMDMYRKQDFKPKTITNHDLSHIRYTGMDMFVLFYDRDWFDSLNYLSFPSPRPPLNICQVKTIIDQSVIAILQTNIPPLKLDNIKCNPNLFPYQISFPPAPQNYISNIHLYVASIMHIFITTNRHSR